MASDLSEYFAEHKGGHFNPAPHYFAAGDYVTYFFRNDRCFARKVDDLLTIYLSMATNELVGCKIHGVQHIMKMAGRFGIAVNNGKIRLGLLFFVGAAHAKDNILRQHYEELGALAKDAVFDQGPLLCA